MAVSELLTDRGADNLELSLLAGGAGLDNIINRPRIQKPGLALAGFLEYIHSGRVQILGKSEVSFLEERPPTERSRIVSQLCRQGGSCFIVTSGLEPPQELLEETEKHAVPLLGTSLPSSVIIDALSQFLEDRLAPRAVIHGVFLDVYGLGVLLLGDSGVGKSECALDLVVRGHRLVSDDVVEIKRRNSLLIGTGPELTRYHMELRGLGIVNVKDLFGVAAVRMTKFLEYVIRLDPWRAGKRYDRLGLDEMSYEILGVELPYVEMPVGPGRNLSVLIEVAARNHLLKLKGYHPARELARRLGERLQPGRQHDDREEPRSAVGLRPEREDG
ncbi:MAG: HPr(Ser) kinase/phosphatase [bacterium]|nr:HPr(Ser) kinase/phosphatase [bacterium]